MNLDLEAEADTTLSSVEKLLSSQKGLLQPIVNQSSPSSFFSLLEGAMNSQSYVPLHNVREQTSYQKMVTVAYTRNKHCFMLDS